MRNFYWAEVVADRSDPAVFAPREYYLWGLMRITHAQLAGQEDAVSRIVRTWNRQARQTWRRLS